MLAAAIIAAWGTCVSFASAEVLPPLLETYGPADPPKGFVGFCDTGPWACGNGITFKQQLRNDLEQVAIEVNSRVNRSIKPETDMAQYGVEESWTLPVSGKGDCEDYALLKKKMLIERGVSAQLLLLTVVSRPRTSATWCWWCGLARPTSCSTISIRECSTGARRDTGWSPCKTPPTRVTG